MLAYNPQLAARTARSLARLLAPSGVRRGFSCNAFNLLYRLDLVDQVAAARRDVRRLEAALAKRRAVVRCIHAHARTRLLPKDVSGMTLTDEGRRTVRRQ